MLKILLKYGKLGTNDFLRERKNKTNNPKGEKYAHKNY